LEFDEALDAILRLLAREGRVSYRGLARRLGLDTELLRDLCEELIYAKRVARDEEGRVLVFTGPGSVETPVPGAPIPAPHEPRPSSPPAHPPLAEDEAERRQLTVMFCDLVDSTRLSSQLDPEDLRELLNAYHAAADQAIAGYEGHVAQYLGDGLLIYFGFPIAHEDDARRAVTAGLDLLDAVRDLDRQAFQDKGVHVAVRIGIHTGEVVVGQVGHGTSRERLALGETPNVAARVQSLAEPGTLLISETTARLVADTFDSRSLGPRALKGVREQIQLLQVISERSHTSESHFEAPSPLVGREAEYGQLCQLLDQSTEGTGRAVVIRGEAGIGKSHLVDVLRAEASRRGLTRIALQCSSYYAQSALHPVTAHLNRLIGSPRQRTADERVAKLESLLHAFEPPLDDRLPLFAGLLGLELHDARHPSVRMSAERRREATHAALMDWIFAEAARLPVLMIWEDVHWADPSTLELLGLFLQEIERHPVLLVLTTRKSFKPPWPPVEWMQTVELERLSATEVYDLLSQRVGGKKLPPELVRQVVERTDGIPLFAEELLQMLLDARLLRASDDGFSLTGHLPAYGIPVTLRDSLMARLDRLGSARGLAQLAAVIGRDFSYEMLRAVAQTSESELRRELMRLTDAELLHQHGSIPDAHFSFKHALIQDAAYDSLLRKNRQAYHAEIWARLREHFPELETSEPELLAHHAAEGGQLDAAIRHLQHAARNAVRTSAHAEAVAHLEKAIELTCSQPDSPERAQVELGLQTAYGPALMALRGYASAAVEQAYARARALCTQVPDSPRRTQVLAGLATYYFTRGALREARELGEQYLALAEETGDVTRILQARLALGSTLYFMGRLREAEGHLRLGLEQARQVPSDAPARGAVGDPRVLLGTYLGLVLEGLGRPHESRLACDEAIALAERYEHPISLAPALDGAALAHLIRQEYTPALERAAAGMRVSEKHGFPTWFALGQVIHGAAQSELGMPAEGVGELAEGIDGWQAAGANAFVPSALCLLARARLRSGDPQAALDAIDRGLRLAEQNDDRCFEAELHRVRALAHAQRSPEQHRDEIERSLETAIGVAREQSALTFELRATLHWLREQTPSGHATELRARLQQLRDAFDTSAATLDLIEADTLLGHSFPQPDPTSRT